MRVTLKFARSYRFLVLDTNIVRLLTVVTGVDRSRSKWLDINSSLAVHFHHVQAKTSKTGGKLTFI